MAARKTTAATPPPHARRGRASEALRSWHSLNQHLRELAAYSSSEDAEESAWKLLETEFNGKRRIEFMLRIHSFISPRRHHRERAVILTGKLVVPEKTDVRS